MFLHFVIESGLKIVRWLRNHFPLRYSTTYISFSESDSKGMNESRVRKLQIHSRRERASWMERDDARPRGEKHLVRRMSTYFFGAGRNTFLLTDRRWSFDITCTYTFSRPCPWSKNHHLYSSFCTLLFGQPFFFPWGLSD